MQYITLALMVGKILPLHAARIIDLVPFGPQRGVCCQASVIMRTGFNQAEAYHLSIENRTWTLGMTNLA